MQPRKEIEDYVVSIGEKWGPISAETASFLDITKIEVLLDIRDLLQEVNGKLAAKNIIDGK